MTTTTRRKKTTPETMPATHTTITISDVCKAENLTEQSFRFALSELRPDDFDTVKSIPTSQADQVLATITSAAKVLPSQAATPQLPETVTPQAIQPSPETAQNQGDSTQENISENSKLAQTQTAQSLGTSTKSGNTKGTVPTALDELIKSAEETIELADLVQVYRNQQIAANTQTRDNELVAQLRERRIERRNQVFDHIRDLNSRQPIAPELPELPASLSDEIKSLSDELGKSLVVG